MEIPKPYSLATAVLTQKKQRAKYKELQEAIAYCKENNCRGWKAISDLRPQFINDTNKLTCCANRRLCTTG